MKAKILNESAFKKIIFLLICTTLMGTCIGSAEDLSTATQEQAGYVRVTNGDVSYGLGQQQSAEVLSGDGAITQDQQSSVKTKTNPHSGVEMVTVRTSEDQNVDTPSTDDSTNNNPTSNVVKTLTTGDDGYIYASQVPPLPETSDGDISQQQKAFLKVIVTPNDKVHAKIHLQQK